MRIGIIGAGIFGCSAAIALSADHKVDVFDQSNSILSGASTSNHLRYHRGYHYPRSPETAMESLEARTKFERDYFQAVVGGFPVYYGISNQNSKTNPSDFIHFCEKLSLPYKVEFPDNSYINRNKTSLCLKVQEEVYDPSILSRLVSRKLSESKVSIHFNHKLIDANIDSTSKKLFFDSPLNPNHQSYAFDAVINATYTGLNNVNRILGLPRKESFYELVELLELSHPKFHRIGLTIVDGEFSSLLPRGVSQTYTLGHVRESILDGATTDNPSNLLNKRPNSRSQSILSLGVDDFPFLKDARIVRSIFIPRVVKAHVDDTDKRPTEVVSYGNNLYSIFAGKVVTAVTAAEKIKFLLSR